MSIQDQHLDAYMVTWGIEREFGGMSTVCLQRAGRFAERYGRAYVVTFTPDPQIPQIAQELVQRGKLSSKVEILNAYLHLAEHGLRPQQKIPARKADPGYDDFTAAKTAEYPDSAAAKFSVHSTAGPEGQVQQVEYFRRDGSVFLRDIKFNDGSRNRRLLEAFDGSGQLAARFPSATAFYRYWLSQMVDHENSLVIVDSKYTATFLDTWKPVHVPKVYAFHSIHITRGHGLATGRISEHHAPIIERRANWDAFVFLTQAQRDAYVARFGEEETSFVIPNPISLREVPDPAPQRGAAELIIAGSLTPNKNVAAALEVIALLKQRGTPARLHVVGDGAQREKLEARTNELGLGDSVVFHGYSHELPRHFASCTAQLFTSSNEGQAMVILEAQGQGCIPVSFDINFGPSDSIRDGHNGFLVPHGDIPAMADRVQQLIEDPQLAAKMSDNAIAFAREYEARDLLTLWEETVSIAQRIKNLGTKGQVPDFEAKIQGVDFLADRGLQLRVDHQATLNSRTSFELVFVNRESGEEISALGTSALNDRVAVFELPAALLGEIQQPKAAVDVSLRCHVGKNREIKRLGVKDSGILPYLTAHQNLSFRPKP